MIVVRRSPEEDPFISEEEKNYIVKKLGRNEDIKINPPWKDIFTSPAVWAIVASHCAENWGFYTLLTQLPTFLSGKYLSACTIFIDK
jgi:ACS family sodium-dependent inorganic phosphate cotransporter